jgi:hypothetical protein
VRQATSRPVPPCPFLGLTAVDRESDRERTGRFASEDITKVVTTPDTRYCPRCKAEKSISAFGVRRNRGKVIPLSYCKPCQVAYGREWRRGAGRESAALSSRASRARYPERRRARGAVNNAISRGHMVPGTCVLGGASCGATEAHHDDYTRPLDVRWVCRRHHLQLDRERREAVQNG